MHNTVWRPVMGGRMLRRQSHILGDWRLSGIVRYNTGLPTTLLSGSDTALIGTTENTPYERPSYSGTANPKLSPGRPRSQLEAEYFNPAAFVQNASGTFGDSQRNLLTGPGINTADVGLAKAFLIKERYNLQFRWEMFNAFNRPSFSTPTANPTSPSNGEITSIGAIPPRVMQGALKFTF